MKTFKCDFHGETEAVCTDFILLRYDCKKCFKMLKELGPVLDDLAKLEELEKKQST